jgi:uncharacterized protein (DUF934 family)
MISNADLAVKTAYRLTLTEWQALTEEERRAYRENVATQLNNKESQ